MGLIDLLKSLVDPTGFPPRWSCGLWTENLGWTYVVADLGIFGAYFAIPAVLLWFKRKRPDLPYPPVFFLFAAFILLCGTSHLVDAMIFWFPTYRLNAAILTVTALVSWATLLSLFKVLPVAIALKSPAELELEVVRRTEELQKAQEALQQSQSDLERVVAERTEALQTTNAELTRFAYAASHDLRSPLRAIDQLSHWVVEDAGEALPAEAKRHLNTLVSRVGRLDKLLSDLLTFSRLGRSAEIEESIDLRALCEASVEVLHNPANLKVVVHGQAHVRGPQAPLAHVVRNLVDNAIKHHDGQGAGEVHVELEERDNNAILRVKDDGPGVPEVYRNRIFELFQTLKSRDQVEGSGMGLALVKKVVEGTGSTISIEDNTPRGLVITVVMPKVMRMKAALPPGVPPLDSGDIPVIG